MDHLPPAPTPPVSNGISANMASNSDRTANLLNLLKFSGSGGGGPQQQQQPQNLEQQHQPEPLSPPGPESQQQQQQIHKDVSPPQTQHLQHFQQQPAVPQAQHYPAPIHQPAPTAADPTGLLAALMRGTHGNDTPAPVQPESGPVDQPPQQHPQDAPQQTAFGNGSPPPDTRSYLLNLLNRPKPGQNEQPLLAETSSTSRTNNDTPLSIDQADRARELMAQFQPSTDPYKAAKQYQAKAYGEAQAPNAEAYPAYAPAQPPAGQADVSSLYQQLIGSLAQQSPPQGGSAAQPSSSTSGPAPPAAAQGHASPAASQNRGSQRGGSVQSPVMSPREHFRPQADRTSSIHSHQSVSRRSARQTPGSTETDRYPAPEQRRAETASDAVSDAAGRDLPEALESAEDEKSQAQIAEELDQMLNADSDKEFHRSARTAARDTRDDPDVGNGAADILDDTLPKEVAEAVRDIVDEATTQGVADSWESADQDEIVVIEEEEIPPVKVFNFPMKPWISITLHEGTTDPRPEFRDEVIMNIARLKKDFDQIDRNLYTASPNYMTYGMSKQGGLRVIRQDDGKDAKVFTDTKDRIFNVSMSVTPTDHEGPYKEAIIGTGISGTVYWVQIRDGEKDHIEDAHLEQYGFALPPMSTADGDTPGGVLKTRARASTNHPEFFAVGRGKTINFVWPSYVMQGNMFKPGHDRVVDTEKLAQKCSLKINTGKAGKDFTFSQDDSVVVSLDKSGRIKFWDVRDLTSAKEGCDPRNPVPAHASLEVKEPLMTFGSTPEGEKAWPTSVMLLDKQRPYQKRCALRYMIVGMKQNHTLQLWDLALGKPVQEFNLPHSKESDAICSVMYHAASGMIIIGHPTRNSIYFAHLSAPKYTLKSVSQAEYIQRLMAQDSSIPQPDSTAVISGVREYSFEDRGILRSLDILPNPAMVQDTDEPTLFELYAMHSKGVACLLIKQRELGWSRDNKVLHAVEAVSKGVVSVSKLKAPQAAETTSAPEPPQPRNGNRSAPKELQATQTGTPPNPNTQAATRAPEPPAASRAKSDARDADTSAAQSSKEGAPEKPERKQRKKKGAAAAGNQSDGQSNGNASSATTPSRAVNGSGISSEALDAAVAGMETRLGTSLTDTFKASLRSLHGKIDDGARAREEIFNQNQFKLLDMVSSVLNENTQKVLEALVHQQFADLVIPAIGDKATRAVNDVFRDKLQPHISSMVQKEIHGALPQALNRSLRSADVASTMAESVGASVASMVQQEMASVLAQRLGPTVANVASQSARQVSHEISQQYHEQFERLNAQRAEDSGKIEQLQSHVQQLTAMISTMATSQSSLHAEIMKLRKSPVHELPEAAGQERLHHQAQARSIGGPGSIGGGGPPYGAMAAQAPSHAPSHAGSHYAGSQAASQVASHASSQVQGYLGGSPHYTRGGGSHHMASPQGSGALEQMGNAYATSGAFANQGMRGSSEGEADEALMQMIRAIEQEIQEGRLHDALIQWLRSGREEDIFRRCLSRYPPSKFGGLSPLMLLVVIATISKNIRPNPRLKEEIEWIEMAVRTFGASMTNYNWEGQGEREVAQSTSNTMSILISRVKLLIDSMQDGFPTDPFLANVSRGKLEWIVRTAESILASSGAQM